MSAKRPQVLEALKALLVAGVPAVSSRVYLPWDAIPDNSGVFIQIEVADSEVDDSEVIGSWLHRVSVRIGAVRSGKFDIQAVWDLLNTASAAIMADCTLSGTVQRIDITGAADSLHEAGERILWPHIAAEIVYLTPAGAI